MALEKKINAVCRIISEGGVVIIPTDTIYGFACDPLSAHATDRIDHLKKREKKPFLVLDSSEERIRFEYFKKSVFTDDIIDKLITSGIWPGKLTLIAEKSENIMFPFLSKFKKIAVRFTSNEIVSYINESLGSGIVSTSCNSSGEKEHTDIKMISSLWSKKVDMILNASITDSLPSIILEIVPDLKCLKVIRMPESEEYRSLSEKIKGIFTLCH